MGSLELCFVQFSMYIRPRSFWSLSKSINLKWPPWSWKKDTRRGFPMSRAWSTVNVKKFEFTIRAIEEEMSVRNVDWFEKRKASPKSYQLFWNWIALLTGGKKPPANIFSAGFGFVRRWSNQSLARTKLRQNCLQEFALEIGFRLLVVLPNSLSLHLTSCKICVDLTIGWVIMFWFSSLSTDVEAKTNTQAIPNQHLVLLSEPSSTQPMNWRDPSR